MIAAGSLEYAYVRMQARLARRPGEAAWAAIEEARALPALLEAARGTGLERLVRALGTDPDLHDADRAAREAWTQVVAEARAWMPPRWSPAVAWCDATSTGGGAYPTLLPSLSLPAWRRLWPEGARDPELAELARLFATHRARFRDAAPHEALALRRGFEARLLAFFRRHAVRAGAAFAWLSLAALDLERFRGEVARRLAFPGARMAT